MADFRSRRAGAALIAFMAPGIALAQTAPPSAPPPDDRERAPMTLQSFQVRMEQRVMAADSDGDGRVSRAEFTAASSGRGNADERFQRMDVNGDGYVDKAEIDAAAAARFQRMDRNGDGVLTPDERMAGRAGGGHGRGQGPQGQPPQGGPNDK